MHDTLLRRMAEPLVSRMLDVFPVVVVTGARQTGKSTLVQLPAFAGREYVTLDDVLIRDQARRDPDLLLRRAPRLIIDEVQHAPDLLLAIKRLVDQRREPGRFILTGSTDLLLQERVSESLAGRAGYIRLWPLTRREQLGFAAAGAWSELLAADPSDWPSILDSGTAPPEDWRDLAERGGYPIPAYRLSTPEERTLWFEGYASTYLERDVGQLSAIESLADMRRLMTALCLRIGGLLNKAEVARDLAVPQTTVKRYIDLLEVSNQLIQVQAYSVNRTKRLIKSPKVYWADTGLALRLGGEAEPRGPHLENIVATDLLAWSSVVEGRPNILHWRTSAQAEVDFVIELGSRLLPIEVKSASRIGARDARHLMAFLEEYSDLAPGGLVLHDGYETFWVARNVLAAPWHRVV